jgi:hypothetical protein
LLIKESRSRRKKEIMKYLCCLGRKKRHKTDLGKHEFKSTLKPVSTKQSPSAPKGFYAVSKYSVETLPSVGGADVNGDRKVLALEGRRGRNKNGDGDELEVRIPQADSSLEEQLLDQERLTGNRRKRKKCCIM